MSRSQARSAIQGESVLVGSNVEVWKAMRHDVITVHNQGKPFLLANYKSLLFSVSPAACKTKRLCVNSSLFFRTPCMTFLIFDRLG